MASKTDPATCEHIFIHRGERWLGNGRCVYWKCNDCESYLRPLWRLVNAFGRDLKLSDVETTVIRKSEPAEKIGG